MKTIRRDERAEFTATTLVGTVVGIMIALMVGLILIPAVSNQTYLLQKNQTFFNGTKNAAAPPGGVSVSQIVPLMFVITVIAVAIVGVLYMVNKVE